MLLEALENLKNKIRIGILGAGSTGRGIYYQSRITPGIQCVAMADLCLETAEKWIARLGDAPSGVNNTIGLDEEIRSGKTAVCQNGMLMAESRMIDVLVDASGDLKEAPEIDLAALENGKHVVMMNAEADLMFGPLFYETALKNKVVYTSCGGDQPGVISQLIRKIRLWGFEPVMAGNLKGYLDRYANPENIVPEAEKRGLDYRACTSYTDGTKLSIEMALVANAYDMEPLTCGMHGPEAQEVLEVLDLFDFKMIRENGKPVVDYLLGARPLGGIFAVGYCDDPYQKFMLDWFPSDLGPGPFYVFHRPYHLVHVESMETVAMAALQKIPLLIPSSGFQTDVYAYAKKNLKPGDRLDGVGGFTCYGMIEKTAENEIKPGLPICLSSDLVLTAHKKKNHKIYLDDVAIPEARKDFSLWERARAASERLAK